MIEANLWLAAALVCFFNVASFAQSRHDITKSSGVIEKKFKTLLHEAESNRQRGLRPRKDDNVDMDRNVTQGSTNVNVSSSASSSSSVLPPNHRFMAMVNIQEPCPTPQQWNQYTDILLSYTTTLQENGTCSDSCQINNPLKVCNNQPNNYLLEQWNGAGKRIWLVVGGPAMGRDSYYDLVMPACWEFCFGRQQQLVESVANLVSNTPSIHGVVISYQYLYENNQNDSGFLRGNEAQAFLRTLTVSLRERLDNGMLLAHMPVDSSVVVGTDYFTLMSELAQNNQFDLLMPQFFNGVIQPASNAQGVLQHLDVLVTFMFLGDSSRVVLGICNNGGDDFNCGGRGFAVDSVEGASIMTSLSNSYPCHGGAFFWSASSDPEGFWSIPLLAEYSPKLEVDACQTTDEQNQTDNIDKDESCGSLLTELSCDDCIKKGCAWCREAGKSICQPIKGNGTECFEVCLPEKLEQDIVWGPNSLVQHNIKLEGLSQEYFGISNLTVQSMRSLEELHASHVESFFSSKIDETLLLDSNITIMEVILPSMLSRSLRRTNETLLVQPMQMQHDGSSVVVVYDQNFSYWYPVIWQMLSPESLSMVPFATKNARDGLTSMLQTSSDPILKQVLGVSEITVAPQTPTESPISTLKPTTTVPTHSMTPVPTQLPQVSPTQTPAAVPIGNETSGEPNSSSPPSNGTPSSSPSPDTYPTNVVNPPATEAPPSQPIAAPPPPGFNTNPPNSVQPMSPEPFDTAAPTKQPPLASTPPPAPNPTMLPTPQPTRNPTGAPNSNKNYASSDDYPIFGKYTGFIVIGIVFVGLLIVFTVHMKYCMGEYVDA
jgi:hypothetical protein